MKIHWKLVLREGLQTGLVFCLGILAVLRVHPIFFADDFPDVAEKELRSILLPKPGIYESVLALLLIFGPLVWGSFRFLSRQDIEIEYLSVQKRNQNRYLHLLIWFFIVTNMDLVFLDWFVIGFLRAPILGVEHLMSAEAVKSYQSYYFHFGEHYLFYGTYLVNLLFPIILLFLYEVCKAIGKLIDKFNFHLSGSTNKSE